MSSQLTDEILRRFNRQVKYTLSCRLNESADLERQKCYELALLDIHHWVSLDKDLRCLNEDDKNVLLYIFLQQVPIEGERLKQYAERQSCANYEYNKYEYPSNLCPSNVIFVGNFNCFDMGGGGSANDGEAILVILAIVLTIIATLLFALACRAMFLNMQAVYYNESRVRALVNIMILTSLFAIAAAVSATVIFSLLSTGQPVALAGFIVTSIITISAFSVYKLIDLILDCGTKKSSYNPYDNFTLTSKDEKRLAGEDVNPLMVRAAIILLQDEMHTKKPALEWDASDHQKLNEIRALRFGKETSFDLNGKKVSCLKQSNSNMPGFFPSAPEPSAPKLIPDDDLPQATLINPFLITPQAIPVVLQNHI